MLNLPVVKYSEVAMSGVMLIVGPDSRTAVTYVAVQVEAANENCYLC